MPKVNEKSEDLNDSSSKTDEINYCIRCKSQIHSGAKICSVCNGHQSRTRNITIFIGTIIGYIAALAVAIFHLASIYPNVKRVLFPAVSVEVLAFKSSDRVTIANESDHDVFISHIHYESLIDREYFKETSRQMIVSQLGLSSNNFKMKGDLNVNPFHTNKAISKTVKKGEILTFKFDRVVPDGLTYTTGYTEEQFDKLIVVAAANYRSEFISAVIFSKNDRRFLQLKEYHKESLNTFPVKASVHVYSAVRKKVVDFQFDAVGTITLSKDPNILKEIKSYLK